MSDAGAAWENLALQASLDNLVAHGMVGFDFDKARKLFEVPEEPKQSVGPVPVAATDKIRRSRTKVRCPFDACARCTHIRPSVVNGESQ